MILLWSVGIESLHMRSSHHSDDSSSCQSSMFLSAQSQKGKDCEWIPYSKVTTKRHRRAWDKSQYLTVGKTTRYHRRQSHSSLQSRRRLWGFRTQEQASHSRRKGKKLWCRVCKHGNTSWKDILPEDDALRCFPEDPVGTSRVRTRDYGLMAPVHVHQAWI